MSRINRTLDLVEKVRVSSKSSFEEKKIAPNELKEIIQEAIKENERDNVSIKLAETDLSTPVRAGSLLKDVISNKIDNAIRHGSADLIKVKIIEDKEITIIVEDNGKGIPDSKKDKIFDKKYTETRKSAGLGLYLSKLIINSYNGKIEVKDSELGGARFEIYLKKAI
ncbi:MAG: Sensory domain [Candidatus Methanohalarchaeum thermophilum]|uniref:histidine kinase n=1 Tax=Methanohalarchaeum thermophilum TaxID=1903181 RepID=A0A1Q6DTY5_METT1|nr:MAG: Sensory domain [Candidatus Methanohalarchaeum thermophilum]